MFSMAKQTTFPQIFCKLTSNSAIVFEVIIAPNDIFEELRSIDELNHNDGYILKPEILSVTACGGILI